MRSPSPLAPVGGILHPPFRYWRWGRQNTDDIDDSPISSFPKHDYDDTLHSINKPGGCAKITKIHWTPDGNYVEGLDVKYLVGGGFEKAIDPAIVSAFETLERGGRKRRGREFLLEREEDVVRNSDQDAPIGSIRNPSGNRTTGKATRKIETTTAVPRRQPLDIPAEPVIANESPPSHQSSTTFSTPEKKTKPKPKKVTPIPSLVVTKMKVDTVSPMTEDLRTTKESKRPHVARRGLAFGMASKSDEENLTGHKNLPHPSQEHLHGGNDTLDKEHHHADGSLSLQGPKNELIVRQSDVAMGIGRPNVGGHSLGVSRRASCKQAPSFARTKSAYDNRKGTSSISCDAPAATGASRQPLLDVYRYEVQKAHEFMNEMVGPRHEDADGLKENTSFMDTSS